MMSVPPLSLGGRNRILCRHLQTIAPAAESVVRPVSPGIQDFLWVMTQVLPCRYVVGSPPGIVSGRSVMTRSWTTSLVTRLTAPPALLLLTRTATCGRRPWQPARRQGASGPSPSPLTALARRRQAGATGHPMRVPLRAHGRNGGAGTCWTASVLSSTQCGACGWPHRQDAPSTSQPCATCTIRPRQVAAGRLESSRARARSIG